MFNDVEYVIQYQKFSKTIFGHWCRKWVNYTQYVCGQDFTYFRALPGAIAHAKRLKDKDIDEKKIRLYNKKAAAALKKNIWKKVWP